MRKWFLLVLSSLSLTACFPESPYSGNNPPAGPDAGGGAISCTRTSAVAGQAEGYPFDPSTFDSQLLPPLQQTCASGPACHGPGNPNNFTVYLDADSSCPNIATFNEVSRLTDLASGPAASPIVTAINGTLAAHPFKPPLTDNLIALLDGYITAAKQIYDEGGGGGDGGSDAGLAAPSSGQ